jgi:hypothetical protein
MHILDLINSSQNVLIVTEQQPDFSALLCATFLIEFLKEEGKNATWLLDKSKLAANFQTLINGYEANFIDSIQSNNFETQIPSQSGVEDILVEKQGDGYKLIFKTKEGLLKLQGLEIQPLQRKFDSTIILSNKQFSRIANFPGLKESSEQQQFVQQKNLAGLACDLATSFFEKKKNLASQQATILLTAMLWEIQGKHKLAELEVINWLVFRCKADLNNSQKILEGLKTDQVKKWKKAVYENLRITPDLIYSFVEAENLKADDLLTLPLEDKLPFAKDFETENLVIITEMQNGNFLVARGKIIEKLINLKTDNFNINAGILSAITASQLDELKFIFGIQVEEEHKSSLADISDELIPETEEINMIPDIEQSESVEIIKPEIKQQNKELKKIAAEPAQDTKAKSPQKVEKTVEKGIKQVENRNTSILNHQKTVKVTKQFATTPPKNPTKSYDPLPAADW